MKHSFIDKYSELKTPIHKLSALSKILFTLFLLMYIAILEHNFIYYIPVVFIITVVILLSRVPIIFILKRIVVVLPFILFISIFMLIRENGVEIFLFTFTKSMMSILCVILLISTTKFQELLFAFEKLKMPKIITFILSFIYRYFSTLIENIEKTENAILARGGKKGYKMVKIFSSILAILIIRSYERSERIYYAMLMRGFDRNFNYEKSN